MRDFDRAMAGLSIMIVLLVTLAGVFGIVYVGTQAVTSIWKETLIDDSFEVEVVDKAMDPSSVKTSYRVLVQGTDLNGDEYCRTETVDATTYANCEKGSILKVHQKTTTQPLFGKTSKYTLIDLG